MKVWLGIVRGFTIVELTVLLAIVATLLAVLMPLLADARQSARKVECAGNLGRYGLVWAMYAQEHAGLLIRTAVDDSDINYLTRIDWTLAKDDPGYSNHRDILADYAPGQYELASCPGPPGPAITDIDRYMYYMYFPGARISSGPYAGCEWAPSRATGGARPYRTAMMQDKCQELSSGAVATNHVTAGGLRMVMPTLHTKNRRRWQAAPYYLVQPKQNENGNEDENGSGNENAGANVLFYDGHVEQATANLLDPIPYAAGRVLTMTQPR